MEPAPNLILGEVQALCDPQKVNRFKQRHKSHQESFLVVDVCLVNSDQVLDDLQGCGIEKAGAQCTYQRVNLCVDSFELVLGHATPEKSEA